MRSARVPSMVSGRSAIRRSRSCSSGRSGQVSPIGARAMRADHKLGLLRVTRMTTAAIRPLLAVTAVVAMSGLMLAQERDRAKVTDKFKWNLADVYPNDAAWRAQKDK